MIGSLSHIDYNVKIGNNTRIEGAVYIPPLTVIGNNVFIGPGATFTNDP
jgi:UDP-3-O-[3-hydroxymyristoyl] glucosamine N-acyltransferase